MDFKVQDYDALKISKYLSTYIGNTSPWYLRDNGLVISLLQKLQMGGLIDCRFPSLIVVLSKISIVILPVTMRSKNFNVIIVCVCVCVKS